MIWGILLIIFKLFRIGDKINFDENCKSYKFIIVIC
jgi:hypothetical protein